MEAAQEAWVKVHPLIVRVTHWINALGILIMVASGWRIYNASPLFPFRIPNELTLGGWLAGALQWHFAAMWLLVINGIAYVTYGIVSGHFRRKFLDRKSTRLNSSHLVISYAVFCLKKK